MWHLGHLGLHIPTKSLCVQSSRTVLGCSTVATCRNSCLKQNRHVWFIKNLKHFRVIHFNLTFPLDFTSTKPLFFPGFFPSFFQDGWRGFIYGIEGQVFNASLKAALNRSAKERIQAWEETCGAWGGASL